MKATRLPLELAPLFEPWMVAAASRLGRTRPGQPALAAALIEYLQTAHLGGELSRVAERHGVQVYLLRREKARVLRRVALMCAEKKRHLEGGVKEAGKKARRHEGTNGAGGGADGESDGWADGRADGVCGGGKGVVEIDRAAVVTPAMPGARGAGGRL